LVTFVFSRNELVNCPSTLTKLPGLGDGQTTHNSSASEVGIKLIVPLLWLPREEVEGISSVHRQKGNKEEQKNRKEWNKEINNFVSVYIGL
jgi:hypothetical protein